MKSLVLKHPSRVNAGNMEHFNSSSNEPAKSYQFLLPFSVSYKCLIWPLIDVMKAILSAKNIAIYANDSSCRP